MTAVDPVVAPRVLTALRSKRWAWSAIAAALLVGLLASAPPAEAGVADPGQRYIDEVFASVTETQNITYGEAVNEDDDLQSLELDLFEPAGDTATDRPVIIWIHGGGFTAGNKNSAVIRRLAQGFARRGYVTASIEYRLGDAEDSTAFNNAFDDLRTAIRWFRANGESGGTAGDFPVGRDLRIDTQRVAAGGYSAGAVMAISVGYEIGVRPGSNQGWPSQPSASISISGAGLGPAAITNPPVIYFHGDQDTRVWYDNGPFGFSAVEGCNRSRAKGVDCIFRTYAGVGHGVPDPSREPEIQAMTAHFLSCRPGAQPSFDDALGRWFEAGAGFMERHEIMTGFPDGAFRGDRPISRAEAVRMLYRYAGSPPVDGLDPHGLSDVPAWVENAVTWAADAEIMTGYPDMTFQPNGVISRAQITRAMHRVAGAIPTGGLPGHGFSDVPTWVDGEVRWVAAERETQALAGSSIMSGFANSTFRPNDPVTRAQAARALRRLAHPASAWSVTLQADPYEIACYRVGDPPA